MNFPKNQKQDSPKHSKSLESQSPKEQAQPRQGKRRTKRKGKKNIRTKLPSSLSWKAREERKRKTQMNKHTTTLFFTSNNSFSPIMELKQKKKQNKQGRGRKKREKVGKEEDGRKQEATMVGEKTGVKEAEG